MIPKLIHLCWFSGDEYPEDIKFCLDSWKRFLPDFQIKVWNKEMALATGIDFVKEAISVKKWAFAADVIRLYAVYHDGGVYMDSDIYVQKRFDEFLEKKCVFFQEYHHSDLTQYIDEFGQRLDSIGHVNGMGIQAALFMAEKGNGFIKDLLDDYRGKHFMSENGTLNMSLIAPELYALKAETYGYKYLNIEQHLMGDVDVYPSSYVGSSIALRTEKSFAVHCIAHSWDDNFLRNEQKKDSLIIRIKVAIYSFYCKVIGKPKQTKSTSFKEKLEENLIHLKKENVI